MNDKRKFQPDRVVGSFSSNDDIVHCECRGVYREETKSVENVDFIYVKTESFDSIVDENNWHLFFSYIYTHNLSGFEKYLDNLGDIHSKKMAIRISRFQSKVINESKLLQEGLPEFIEKSIMSGNRSLSKEMREIKVPRLKNMSDDFDFTNVDSHNRLQAVIFHNFFNELNGVLDKKIENAKKMISEKLDEFYIDSVGKMKEEDIILNKMIYDADVLCQSINDKKNLNFISNLLNSIYYCEFIEEDLKKIIADRELIYIDSEENEKTFLEHKNMISGRLKKIK